MPAKDDSIAKKFTELDEIVEWFDSDDVDLEKSLEKFERGATLSKEIKKYLDEAENKVKKIKADFES